MRRPLAGLGFKPHHLDAALAASGIAGLWFEVHPENYALEGGPRLAALRLIAERFPLAFHGVGLSLGSAQPLDADHLTRIAALVRAYAPALVSEHLAWNRWQGVHHPDLFPVPRTTEALNRVAANIARVQDAFGRVIAIENPSHYLALDVHAWDEVEFLVELSTRTGCDLLIDVNNVAVSANNLGYDATRWLARVPGARVSEIHIAGYTLDPALGAALRIDSHDAPIAEDVWELYAQFIARIGPKPTLIERDGAVPPFAELLAERERTATLLAGALTSAA